MSTKCSQDIYIIVVIVVIVVIVIIAVVIDVVAIYIRNCISIGDSLMPYAITS